MLSPVELSRYRRQVVLPELGVAGQERLRSSRVLIVGAGGLGSPAALYLAAAGVGTLGISDDDFVELSNLHRQILHGTSDIGAPKAMSAAASLRDLNPLIEIRTHPERVTASTAAAVLEPYDVIVDGSDNFPTRYAINDACAALGKIWVYGSVERFSGQVSVFGSAGGPCYRCLFAEPPSPGTTANCDEIGVLGAVPGVIGSLQAVEAIKCLTGIGEPLIGRMLQLDLSRSDVRIISFARNPDCQACGATASGKAAPPPREEAFHIEPSELARRMSTENGFVLLDIREPWEWDVARIGAPRLLPLGDLESRASELDRSRELIVYCHHGTRSTAATEWLREMGFRARNLSGGIDRWSREIDASVARY